MLTDAEKRFVLQAQQANAPMTFIVHHIWLCRQLEVDPEMNDLAVMDEDVQAFLASRH